VNIWPTTTITAMDDLLCLGLMFASVAWMELAGSLLGGVMQNAVFAATVSWMMNFVFMLDAAMYLVAAVLTMYVTVSGINSQIHSISLASETSTHLLIHLSTQLGLISSVCFTFTAFHSWQFMHIIIISTLLNSCSFSLSAQKPKAIFFTSLPTIDF